jgi:beta-lactamase regulating signal transducer with metallopeptidase domain
MKMIFQNVLQMSFYGSIAIMAVLILRRLFNRLPKKVICLFWLVPGLRLLCPLNFNTIFSVMNFAKLSGNTEGKVNEVANAVIPVFSKVPHAIGEQMQKDAGAASVSNGAPVLDLSMIMALVWLAGMALILAYLVIRTYKLLDVLSYAKRVRGKRYYVSDDIDTSFVLGIVHPRIYMQSGLSKEEESYILLHERTHIRNKDHITRIIGVLTVCLHWFNPLVWIAFGKMCTDLEMRCDEAVVERMGSGIKREYCRSMINHALDRSTTSRGLSVAFSGDNCSGREIKLRIKNLINYKKVSKLSALLVILFGVTMTVVLSTKAEVSTVDKESAPAQVVATPQVKAPEQTTADPDEEKVGAPVGVPGNINLELSDEECLEVYGKEELPLPDDVVYSDEGRPYSKTYDFRSTPILKKLGDICEKSGYEVDNCEGEYLDRENNVQTGRELYCFWAYKEKGDDNMLLNFYMVSEDYAKEDFTEKQMQSDLWITSIGDASDGNNWFITRLYDPKTGVMMDASGTYPFDWENSGLFD